MKNILVSAVIACTVALGASDFTLSNGLRLRPDQATEFCRNTTGNTNAGGSLDSSNPCILFCTTTQSVRYFLRNGENCSATEPENRSKCFRQQCVAINQNDLTKCRALEGNTDLAIRPRNNNCVVECYNLASSAQYTNRISLNGESCFRGRIGGTCQRGVCRR